MLFAYNKKKKIVIFTRIYKSTHSLVIYVKILNKITPIVRAGEV